MLGVDGGVDDDESKDGMDDDDELLQDAVFLSMNAGNYWRVEEQDDWLKMFDDALSGEEATMNQSRDDLDEYGAGFYEEGEFHPNNLPYVKNKVKPPRAPTPPTWMSSISRRHLQFYNLISTDDIEITSSHASDAGDSDAVKETPLPAYHSAPSCASNWTPSAQLAQHPEGQKWASTTNPMSPCLAHLTPTVKRSDSKVSWLKRKTITYDTKSPTDLSIKGEDDGNSDALVSIDNSFSNGSSCLWRKMYKYRQIYKS